MSKNFYQYIQQLLHRFLQLIEVDIYGLEPYYGLDTITPVFNTLSVKNCFVTFGGGYRSRTDDPLRARQML